MSSRCSNMPAFKDRGVEAVFMSYPQKIRTRLLCLRQLIIDTAAEIDGLGELEETLKWGEPSYLTKPKIGSTIRLGWKQKFPEQYAVFFNCKTTLVDTFKERYGGKFKYEGNRALVFNVSDEIPVEELQQCISLSLTYHRRKNVLMSGI